MPVKWKKIEHKDQTSIEAFEQLQTQPQAETADGVVLDELEEELKIHVRPLTWPIESGVRFKGVYNIYEQSLDLFTPNKQKVSERVEIEDINETSWERTRSNGDRRYIRG